MVRTKIVENSEEFQAQLYLDHTLQSTVTGGNTSFEEIDWSAMLDTTELLVYGLRKVAFTDEVTRLPSWGTIEKSDSVELLNSFLFTAGEDIKVIHVGSISLNSEPSYWRRIFDEVSSNSSNKSESRPSEWLSSSRGPLVLTRFSDPVYILEKSITWLPDEQNRGIEPFKVPRGFVTDLSSTPKAFWSLFNPDSNLVYPGVLLDYLYWSQHTTREVADQVYRAALLEFGVSNTKVTLLYSTVRSLGRNVWENNRKKKENGERRVLKRFPEDPNVTWAEWKSIPGVFE